MSDRGQNPIGSFNSGEDRSPLVALVRLCARQAAREWLSEARPADPTKEAVDEQ